MYHINKQYLKTLIICGYVYLALVAVKTNFAKNIDRENQVRIQLHGHTPFVILLVFVCQNPTFER